MSFFRASDDVNYACLPSFTFSPRNVSLSPSTFLVLAVLKSCNVVIVLTIYHSNYGNMNPHYSNIFSHVMKFWQICKQLRSRKKIKSNLWKCRTLWQDFGDRTSNVNCTTSIFSPNAFQKISQEIEFNVTKFWSELPACVTEMNSSICLMSTPKSELLELSFNRFTKNSPGTHVSIF